MRSSSLPVLALRCCLLFCLLSILSFASSEDALLEQKKESVRAPLKISCQDRCSKMRFLASFVLLMFHLSRRSWIFSRPVMTFLIPNGLFISIYSVLLGINMSLRKVQRTGGGTFFVCLPKSWAMRAGLKKSSVVALSETADGRLVLDARYDVERSPQVAVIRPSPLLDREIMGKYLLGYDIIRVEAKDRMGSEDRQRIKQSSSRLIGLEIVEEDYSKIVMQCLLEPAAFPPDKALQREHSIASGMHRDAVTAFVEGDSHLAKNVVARDIEVNRFYFLLVRVLRTIIQNPGLSEKLGILPIDCLDYRLTASLVEAIGDQSVRLAEAAVEIKGAKIAKELSQSLLRLHKVAFDTHESALKAMFARDIGSAEALRNERKTVEDLVNEIEVSVHRNYSDIAPQMLAAATAIRQIFGHGIDIADLVMPKTP
jgi:phosphate uptake regulator